MQVRNVPAVVSIDPPGGWRLWHDGDDGTLILAFRPDVFDADQFPASCLPTIVVKRERTRGGRGRPRAPADGAGQWCVELRLEPDVEVVVESHAAHSRAVDRAIDLAGAFTNGEIDYRTAYIDPPASYVEALDRLIESDGEPGSRGLTGR